jgi:phosphinothricin acetyltransferase
MSEISIRPAGPNDLAAITRIYADAVRSGTASFEIDPPDQNEMARRFAALCGSGFPYLVAEGAGSVAGYAYAGPYRGRPAYRWTVEDSIYVAAGLQRRGIGRALLDRLIREAETRGFRQMIAIIWRFQAGIIDRAARRRGIPYDRNIRGGRLQVRSLARQRPHAARARQRRRHRPALRPRPDQPATTLSDLSRARRTRSSSWPRRTISPVAEIKL